VSNEYPSRPFSRSTSRLRARSQIVSGGAATTTLYASAVSSTFVALAFIGQRSEIGDAFNAFALVALATLRGLGVLTFVRLVQSANEDLAYGRAINRIRGFYRKLAGERASLFTRSAHDDIPGVPWNMRVAPSRWQLCVTAAMRLAVLNSVVAGAATALAVAALSAASSGVTVAVGGALAILSIALHARPHRNWRHAGAAQSEPRSLATESGQRTDRRR
jgi:hypothetical protein